MENITLPRELRHKISEFPDVDWSEVEKKAIELKLFELELKRSKRLSLLLLKALTSKSKLSEEEADKFAVELARRIKKGRFEQLKSMGVV